MSSLRCGCKHFVPWLSLTLLLFPVTSAVAQVYFSGEILITDQADGANGVFSADLDGDGDYDVLSASAYDNKIAWYENTDGLGNFGPQQIITTIATGAVTVFSVDLDGDGDYDVLSASDGDSKIAWYENTDGLGSFGPQQVIDTQSGAWSVFSADLDGDGDYDVLSAFRWESEITWYENTDGLGSFGPRQIINPNALNARCVFSSDLDGDGDNDVLSASYDDDKIAWYENLDGLGSFSPQQTITTSADGAYSVYGADLDGDGDPDVLSASVYDNKVAWYENMNGLGDFGPEQIISTNTVQPRSVFSIDLDGDGDNDVLTASEFDNTVSWYENLDGLGDFGPQQIVNTNADGAMSVFSIDLNNDGDNDILSASLGDDKIAWYRNLLIFNGVTLTLTPQVTVLPADGGTLFYTAHLVSSLPSRYSGIYYWTSLVMPNGNPYGPIEQRIFTLQPEMDTTLTLMRQNIPGYTPAGEYEFWMYVGYQNGPNVGDSFTFTKLGTVLSGGVDNWDASGNWLNDVFTETENIPLEYAMKTAYPNPFNPATNITISLPQASRLSVTAYNVAGQQVAVLADGSYSAGQHTLTFDGSDMATGLYFIHAVVPGEMNEIQKVVFAK